MRLTSNFSFSEFVFSETALRLGIPNIPPIECRLDILRLARWLQTLRNRLSKKYNRDIPISVTSGYRSPRLNKKIRGSKTSDHMKGLAADIKIHGFTVSQAQALIVELMADCPYDQCIDEFSGWIHIGLAEDGEMPRMQNLIARKRVSRFGKRYTEYLLY
jgi:hypothetical protein